MATARPALSAYRVLPHQDLDVRLVRPGSLRLSQGGPSGLLLDLAYKFVVEAVVEGRSPRLWHATTRMYEYRLLDRDERELLVYHWQPGADFLGPDHPHLHVSASLHAQVDARNRREIGLDRMHLPTGHVSIASIVRMLVTEFEIAPLRDDWRETLDRTEATFLGRSHV